ncbi:hypothetical protein ES703_95193 [subsurface metagenome]
MPRVGLPETFDKMERHTRAIQNMPLNLDREKLKWEYIRELGQKRAQEMLISVREAQSILGAHRREVRESLEASVLRGVLGMAESDLCRIVEKPLKTVEKPLINPRKSVAKRKGRR